ncbi:MAG: serine acetyltransferase [Bacteroidota bacterium]
MILSHNDYLHYLESDRIALKKKKRTIKYNILDKLDPDYIWRFQRLLRKCEYYKNVKSVSFLNQIFYIYLKLKFKKLSLKLGFTIPENVFGPGLAIIHYGTIIVNAEARVGSNCRIQACTVIGQSGGIKGSPTIGDNVYIAPGVKIYGEINIPNNTAIAANAAVNKSFVNENTLIGGVPAKEISHINIKQIIKHI